MSGQRESQVSSVDSGLRQEGEATLGEKRGLSHREDPHSPSRKAQMLRALRPPSRQSRAQPLRAEGGPGAPGCVQLIRTGASVARVRGYHPAPH